MENKVNDPAPMGPTEKVLWKVTLFYLGAFIVYNIVKSFT
jgi:hypothetical protein